MPGATRLIPLGDDDKVVNPSPLQGDTGADTAEPSAHNDDVMARSDTLGSR
jgi:hypothetical protein